MKTDKILHIGIVEPRGQGGMIHYAYQMSQALAVNGANVRLVTSTQYELEHLPHNFIVDKYLNLWDTTPSRSKSDGAISRLAVWIFKKFRRVFRGIQYIAQWIRLVRYLDRLQLDIIQFGKIEFPFEAIFLSWLKKRGHTLTQICHEFEVREQSGSAISKYREQLDRSIYDNFALMYFHAESNKTRFLELYSPPSTRYEIIPHGNEGMFAEAGIDLEIKQHLQEKYGVTPDDIPILFFGLLAPSKGIPDLVEAFSIVREQDNRPKLIIAGGPSKHFDLEHLKKMLSQPQLEGAVSLDAQYVPIEHVGALMDLAHFVVYPYTSSTQSGSLQVAYTFGRPVIATDVGGLPEVVEHQKSGLVVPPGSPEAIAQAILDLVSDPQKVSEMGEYARHLSETKFSWTNIAKKIVTDYYSIL